MAMMYLACMYHPGGEARRKVVIYCALVALSSTCSRVVCTLNGREHRTRWRMWNR